MSKIRLSGSNSGYVEIAAAADAGNLTFTMPTTGTALFGNGNNVISGITTFNQAIVLNSGAVVSGSSIFSDDVTFDGATAGYDVVWDRSDNALEFAANAKATFGASQDMQLYHDGNHGYIADAGTGNLRLRSGTLEIQNLAGSKTSAVFSSGGGQTLNFNNNPKFVTTNTGAVVTGICTATSFSGSGEGLTYTSPLSHRNIIINGDMRVAQRGTSASMSSSGNDFPACDRWSYNRNGPNATVAQVAEAPDGSGFKYSLKWTNTSPVGSISAGNALIFLYKIEGQDIRRLGYGHSSGKIATLSFYAKGSLAGKVGVACRRDGRIFSANSDMTANTWQRHSIVIPVDASTGFSANDNANGWQFGICWGGGSNSTSGTTNGNWINFHNAYTAGFTAGQQGAYLTTNGSTFQITGVQLEIGSQATPFEHRSIEDELQRCKRYFARHGWNTQLNIAKSRIIPGINEHPTNYGLYVNFGFDVEMRAQPTVTFGSNVNVGRPQVGVTQKINSTTTSLNSPSGIGFMKWPSSGSTGGQLGSYGDAYYYVRMGNDGNSYIDCSAEL
jgi:ribosome-associated translation inhibitor RaiA